MVNDFDLFLVSNHYFLEAFIVKIDFTSTKDVLKTYMSLFRYLITVKPIIWYSLILNRVVGVNIKYLTLYSQKYKKEK